MSRTVTAGQDVPERVRPLVEEARSLEQAGQFGQARTRYEEGLRLLAITDGHATAAALLRWVGNTHRAEGDGEAALDCYGASFAVAELNDDALNMSHAVNWMGIVHQEWGQLDLADEYYRRARDLAESIGDAQMLAMVDQNMGTIANVRGDLVRALHHYQRSLERYREVGEERYLGQVLNNLGMIQTDLQQWAQAEAIFEEAATASERIDDWRTRVMVETNRTELLILQGDLGRARESCDAAFELASRLEHKMGLGEVYKNYGIIFREMGKYSLAETHLQSACEIAERYTNPLLAGEVQRELAQAYRAQDRNREALFALNYAHRVFSDLRARLDLADVGQRLSELESLYLEVVRKWGESIESKDRYTAGHCQRVADYGCKLAKAVGFDDQTLSWFRMGAFLHDVGKTVVSAEVLNKPGPLTDEEWDLMKRHTLVGAEIVAAMDFPWDIGPMVRNHHERWDGSGYPDGLRGRAIPLAARILCVADVFDALTTNRSYRGSFTPEQAMAIMEADSGVIFDSELLAVFRPLVLGGTRAVVA
jgi:putative nucleotidyltransferase with HDIG domain